MAICESQRVQRFATMADLEAARCTVEEREEYEPHLAAGSVVFAGVDYAEILRLAENEADVIVWDGGNNDFPFCEARPPHHGGRCAAAATGRNTSSGEAVARMADVFVINKIDSAPPSDVELLERELRAVNARAAIVRAASPIRLDDPSAVKGRRVLVIEDGPTITHGGMPYGAGYLAAVAAGADVIDPGCRLRWKSSRCSGLSAYRQGSAGCRLRCNPVGGVENNDRRFRRRTWSYPPRRSISEALRSARMLFAPALTRRPANQGCRGSSTLLWRGRCPGQVALTASSLLTKCLNQIFVVGGEIKSTGTVERHDSSQLGHLLIMSGSMGVLAPLLTVLLVRKRSRLRTMITDMEDHRPMERLGRLTGPWSSTISQDR